ncbi:MAG: hypothetical protein ABIQ02_13815 [Saprospiraceae bacterium]
MKRNQILPAILVIISSATFVAGQGCSDAGACTIPSFRPSIENMVSQKKNQFNVGLSVGTADHNIFVVTPLIGYSRKLGSSFSVDGQVTAALHSGNGVTTSGPGDVFININYLPSSKFSLTGGIKIPLSNGGRFYADDIVFPMDYQSSLGTLDLIAGIAYKSKGWQLNFAYQQPITQNDNQFYPNAGSHPESPFNDFPSSFGFERQGDILMHISRVILLNDHLTFIPGLLPIYHLGKDGFYNNQDMFEDIDGSEGLTLNATLYSSIQMSDSGKLGINVGFPIIVRDVRPDGLTRSFVLGAEYSIAF